MIQSFPLWLEFAAKEVGQKEIPGTNAHNNRILEYHSSTLLKATSDEVPWCSSFACWVMEKSGIESPRNASAMSWGSWGKKSQDERIGSIVLLKFDTATNPSGAHVGFVWWSDSTKLLVLGGNQKDSVNILSFNRSRILGFRWPTHWESGLPMSESGRKLV